MSTMRTLCKRSSKFNRSDSQLLQWREKGRTLLERSLETNNIDHKILESEEEKRPQ